MNHLTKDQFIDAFLNISYSDWDKYFWVKTAGQKQVVYLVVEHKQYNKIIIFGWSVFDGFIDLTTEYKLFELNNNIGLKVKVTKLTRAIYI